MSRFPNAQFLISAASATQFPGDHGAEVAFVGRSNAGKSSAINALAQRQGLARTSKTPGRTRLLNFFELAPQRRIIDLPGYGYARASSDEERRAWRAMTEALKDRVCLRGLFVIIDVRRGITEGDEGLLDWALPGHRIHVLLSKADKLTRNEGIRALRDAGAALEGRNAAIQLFSAHSGLGVDAARDTLAAWLEKQPGAQ